MLPTTGWVPKIIGIIEKEPRGLLLLSEADPRGYRIGEAIMHIRSGDFVEVTTGDDRGKRGKVVRVDRKNGKLVVEGVNRVYRHMKPTRRNPQGGRLSKEMPIDVSNVMLIDPQSGQKTRVGVRTLADGTRERYAKKSGTSLGVLRGPKKKAEVPPPARA
jgi:large subunit ribosomal protein L24